MTLPKTEQAKNQRAQIESAIKEVKSNKAFDSEVDRQLKALGVKHDQNEDQERFEIEEPSQESFESHVNNKLKGMGFNLDK